MRSMFTAATVRAALAVLAAAPLAAQAATAVAPSPEPSPASAAPVAPVADYTVFVDAPTGFVFVKLPQGWKFAGKSDAALPAVAPAHVVTRLLPAEAPEPARTACAKL